MNFKDIFRKKFTLTLIFFGVATVCFWTSPSDKFTSSDYKEIVLGLGLAFLAAQAYVDVKKPEGGE